MELPNLYSDAGKNLSRQQQKILAKFCRTRKTTTIKPADKNLGIVIIDTDDYLTQCCTVLSDNITYRLATSYPDEVIKTAILNTVIPFKDMLVKISPSLYKYLLPPKQNHQIPKFYGVPKIHKQYSKLPPMRPIIAQAGSMLTPTARFIDHVLQPLAQSYNDYLQNSTSLILNLQDMKIPDTAILVSIDVESLYPSIPQSECLNIVYQQMLERRHLILTDPNLIIRLLHVNVNYNYFEFAGLTFQQTHGTAMGAAFFPTIANIFLSVTLQNFLGTQHHKPVLLYRYIDDIFLIWPEKETLKDFLTSLNSFHPNLKFTHTSSESSINFLDLTIYKGPDFSKTRLLDLKTYQKPWI